MNGVIAYWDSKGFDSQERLECDERERREKNPKQKGWKNSCRHEVDSQRRKARPGEAVLPQISVVAMFQEVRPRCLWSLSALFFFFLNA